VLVYEDRLDLSGPYTVVVAGFVVPYGWLLLGLRQKL
jgi:hypothetical protein